ncbi:MULTISPECIES: phosphonate metabolism transcriptional regulator PhnF [unclassified Motilimonas]|uniref:phosphonate metabolism transcriptional regulator PhnF n=1 Tax=unclassified Motilimonas TaxID=2643697 RepID=UPI001E3CBDD8|nr:MULTISPECIES: phosphonate metabolism transcriptional regulator PhnF [unclassified Motilimonas]MCE0557017.1 phosphonate metabolism transcriptional regulator PhnF [Motilimonas sp. E26]MDO6527259.1 phosphonate metabolism transcriptional regulator PhnF [Motilimonas sp. 1_MG-2023]
MARYQEIALSLEQEISQAYHAGQYLPAEQRLAERYQVNRHTLRRAIDELVGKGWLLRQQGKGVMVLSKPVRYPLHAGAKFTDNLLNIGAAPTSQLLNLCRVDASERISEALQIPIASQVVQLKTLRFIDDTPVSLVFHHFKLGEHEIALGRYQEGSVHQFLKQHCHITLKRQHTVIGAQLPSANDSACLQVPSKTPLLRLQSINVDQQHQPFEFSVSHIRAELVELSLEHPL